MEHVIVLYRNQISLSCVCKINPFKNPEAQNNSRDGVFGAEIFYSNMETAVNINLILEQ